MRVAVALGLAILLRSTSNAVDVDSTALVRRSAERMVERLLAQDHEAYMEFIHPALIERVGGDHVFLALLMAGETALDDFGFSLDSCTITGVDSIVEHEGRTFAIVSERVELSSPEGQLQTDSFLVGILENGATDWKFIDGSGLRADPASLDALFPGVLLKLRLPTKGEDRFVPDDDS